MFLFQDLFLWFTLMYELNQLSAKPSDATLLDLRTLQTLITVLHVSTIPIPTDCYGTGTKVTYLTYYF